MYNAFVDFQCNSLFNQCTDTCIRYVPHVIMFSQCTDTCSRYVSTTIENEIESPTTIPTIL